MAARSAKRRRTSEAQERFRDAFLDQAGDQLVELAGLVEDADKDTIAMAAAELERLADTAGTLGLGHLERASRSAAGDLSGGRRLESLRIVAQALRRTRGRPRIGPILIVAAEAHAASLGTDFGAVAEGIRVYPDLNAFTHAIHVEEPSSVVLPMEALDAVRQLSEYEDFPVIVHGPPDALEGLAAAMAHGAVGYVPRPLSVAEVTRQVRWRTSRPDVAEVFVLVDDGPAREALVRAIEGLGLGVTASDQPAELASSLSSGHADAVIMGAEVQGVPCASLAALARGHATHGHLPLMILGRPKSPQRLRSAGIDDLMRDNADPTHVAQRVRDRVHRFLALPWRNQLAPGLLTRLGTLEVVDSLLRDVQRHQSSLCIVLIQVDGIHVMPPHQQRGAVRSVRQLVVHSAAGHLRRDDIIGELMPGAFLMALPHAKCSDAKARLEAWRKALRTQVRAIPDLKGLSLRLGMADTTMGVHGVTRRAERDLAG